MKRSVLSRLFRVEALRTTAGTDIRNLGLCIIWNCQVWCTQLYQLCNAPVKCSSSMLYTLSCRLNSALFCKALMIEACRLSLPSVATDLHVTSHSIAVASVDGHIRKYDIPTGTLLQDIEAHSFGLNCLKSDRFDTYLISAADDGHIKVWDGDGQLVTSLLGHSSYVQCLDIDPQNLLLLSGGQDNSVFLWDLRNLAEISAFTSIHREAVTSVNFSHDSSVFLTSSFDGTIHLWDTVSLNSIKTLSYARATPISAARFTTNSNYVLGICLNNSGQLWDVLDVHSNIFRTYTGFKTEKYRVPLHVADEFFYCGSEDGKLWKCSLENEAEALAYKVASEGENLTEHLLNAISCRDDLVGVLTHCPNPPGLSVATLFHRSQ